MKYSAPYRFQLKIEETVASRKNMVIELDGNPIRFSAPLTKNKVPKIYVMKIAGEIVYIGYTSQSITTRLNNGLRANGKTGYHGYKWKNEIDQMELLVFVFDATLTDDKEQNKPIINFVEAIEAELVFQHREQTGNWPKFQHEIHFNNWDRDRVLEISKHIYRSITE
ncbi:hypothetical protein IF125_12895 [Empedobacter stercoris]|uniref:hypothetical protein n=1 Tax=Empedobacter stercoris TaxID=1628248 RepID=UPI001CE229CC|nr:hypothetical protein [Empedobacter stercoris]MCA4783140.1 hypothetical protein [Empedobacter stercoris]